MILPTTLLPCQQPWQTLAKGRLGSFNCTSPFCSKYGLLPTFGRELPPSAPLTDNRFIPAQDPENQSMSAVLQPNVAADRKAFYDRIDKASVTPLWEVLHGLITPTPNTPCKPYLWKWEQMWPWIQEA